MDEDLIKKLSEPTEFIVDELPVEIISKDLPFNKLTWENFERFCFQLGTATMDCLETSYIYGRKGQKQDGIDIYFT